MPKYRVRYVKKVVSFQECYMTVEAADPQTAFLDVENIQTGEVDPTDEEAESEEYGKEYSDETEFSHMEEPTDYGVVSQVIEEDAPGGTFYIFEPMRDYFLALKAPAA